jgi:hypothetical protein
MLLSFSFKKKAAIAGVFAALSAISSIAQTHADKEIQEDVKRHRAMAAAHEAAAKCLEGGKKHDACMKELQASCKGLGIGKYCGMRHEH